MNNLHFLDWKVENLLNQLTTPILGQVVFSLFHPNLLFLASSLCIHTKFVSQNAFIESSAVEDVYHEDGTFVVRSFAQLLYNKVGEGGIVPTRTIRQTLVSVLD